MLTRCEHTKRTMRADLNTELVKLNGETDHIHLLMHYPPTLALSTHMQRLNGHTAYALRPTPRIRRPPHLRPHPRTPLVALLLPVPCRYQATHRRPNTRTLSTGLATPPMDGWANPCLKQRLAPKKPGHRSHGTAGRRTTDKLRNRDITPVHDTAGELAGDLVDPDHQRGGDRRPALTTPGQPQAVGGGGRHRHRRVQQL
jgi:REP element-mobilizing transposase RayT